MVPFDAAWYAGVEEMVSVRVKEAAREQLIPPCDRCLRCVGACPTRALEFRDTRWRVNLSRCIFCGACARRCPRQQAERGRP